MDKAGIRLIAHGAVSDDDNLNLTGDAALGLVSADDYSAAHPSEMNKKFTADFARLINGGRPNALMSTGSSGGASCIKVRIRPAASVPARRTLASAGARSATGSPRSVMVKPCPSRTRRNKSAKCVLVS